MKLRFLKLLLSYLTAALLLAVITVGLINTYLGVDSPVRQVVDRIVSLMPPLPSFLGRLWDEGLTDPVDEGIIRATQNSVVSAGQGSWHQPVDDMNTLCGAPDVSTVPVWSARTAYTWVNEDGVRSFSDAAPSELTAQALAMDEGNRDFETQVIWDGVRPNRALEGRLRAGALRINEQWGEWVGRDALVRSQVSLRITSDRKRFLRDWGGDANGTTPSGFYSLARNEAIVFYDSRKMSEARLVEVVFHEVAHLITTWQVGTLPPWYGEGLAEYFESMQVQWQSAEFRTRGQWINRAKRTGIIPLQRLLTLDAGSWFSGDIQSRYLTAGALVAFMMTTDRGREELAALALQAGKTRCSPRSAKQHWSPAGYPGGVRGLEKELRRWLS
ncbi:hypothetical protein R0137_06365 [Congregibacter brevis]|uniref:Peptidase MA superfamily protein n=1 Tax=Congregibacter brevis TaxID=3081201 RepID=A0ABZ0IG94_9GAMM|nr:hypothetical protein R0137_06365 [Congregibacter sp. IMCC45268]